MDWYLPRERDTSFRAGCARWYSLGTGDDGEDVDDIGVAGAAEPVASSAEGQGVDHAVLVAAPHLLEELTGSCIEDADVDAFFGGGGHLVTAEGEDDRVED